MKLKINSITGFSLLLLIINLVVFALHITILKELNQPLFNNKIILAYLVNFILAIGIFSILYILKNTFESILGFIFLGGSFLKFAVFFLLFYPSYKDDGVITSYETFSFLTPYFLCLILEILALVKLMNNND
ncbi:MAG: hypothetical protein R3342_08860 [Lutibacter sp.]|uniref:hypothetical protein n=1 Tax=Lutibacter sp. TaxID=1925666 RepID=UPI00299CF2D7|nr:hypothetical protein [Lutibacter sp.]MDX1829642.1 hypothetical protein [Lutibacter sp.]